MSALVQIMYIFLFIYLFMYLLCLYCVCRVYISVNEPRGQICVLFYCLPVPWSQGLCLIPQLSFSWLSWKPASFSNL